MKLLFLSNGHGEDTIAVQILEQLQLYPNAPELAALPLVGVGHAYSDRIPIIGPTQSMPSGGFVYMDSRQLWRDMRGGLLNLTYKQFRVVRQWAASGGFILAVGDIVPLLFAWASGADYAFVGTAKSEYYLRDEAGWLPQTSWLERKMGSDYHPWERFLMSCDRCKAVFPRDTLTTETLQQWSIPAFDFGNPMMDGFDLSVVSGSPLTPLIKGGKSQKIKPLTVVLLPGSRIPEAEENWQKIIRATESVISLYEGEVVFLAAIAPGLSLHSFCEYLSHCGWFTQNHKNANYYYTKQQATLLLSQNSYQDYLLAADVAIAMAGTATEQFVGLGKPAIAIPGNGPQFTPAFAEAQTRLLGPSVILVENPDDVGAAIKSLLEDSKRFQLIVENGQRRMGKSGAAKRIAESIINYQLRSGCKDFQDVRDY